MSLDGHVSGREGSLDFFAPLVRSTYAESDTAFLKSIDCILFGRKTYEQFVSVWPARSIEGEPLARTINTTQKLVFSSTLKAAPWGQWEAATVVPSDPISSVKALKEASGGSIIVWASVSLAQQLLLANLVDEFHFYVCPALTGSGTRLFPKETHAATLQLVETHTYKNGVVFLNYKV